MNDITLPRRRALLQGMAAIGGGMLLSACGGGGDDETKVSAATAPTQFVDVRGRRLAYASVGTGRPLVLCNRFRGTIDLWDPAFIDALAARGFQVIVFDYSGLGASTGNRTYDPVPLAQDAKDLIDALGLKNPIMGGWSLGGIVAQVFLAMFGSSISQLVLLATSAPGPLVKTAEQLFYDTAVLPGPPTVDQFTTLFFEPADAGSRAASKRSFDRIFAPRTNRSPEVPVDWAAGQLANFPRNPVLPPALLEVLRTTTVPVLHICADHDIIFPVENWYALNDRLPTVNLITYPRAGHGPHHQEPELAAQQIAAFIQATTRT